MLTGAIEHTVYKSVDRRGHRGPRKPRLTYP